MELFIQIFLYLLGVYMSIGLVFALFFVNKGLSAIDHDAQNSGLWLKLILFPASAAFWMILLIKWFNSNKKGHGTKS